MPSNELYPPKRLLVFDLQNRASNRVLVRAIDGFRNTSFWNLQVDEQDGQLLVTSVNASGFAIVTVDSLDGRVLESDMLPCSVRQAVSAFDSLKGEYWFFDVSSNMIRSYNRFTRSLTEGIDFCTLAATACKTGHSIVLHFTFESNRRMLYIVASKWRSGDQSTIVLVTMNANTPSASSSIIYTAVYINKMQYFDFAFDFGSDLLFASTANSQKGMVMGSQMVMYNMHSNTSRQVVLSNVGQIVDMRVRVSRLPVIQSLSLDNPNHIEVKVCFGTR